MRFIGITIAWIALALGVQAQEFPISRVTQLLVINQEQLLLDSELGKHILALEEEEKNALLAEGSRISEEFVAEELELTEKRDQLPPEEFRQLAEAFDAKVVAMRAQQDQSDRAQIARNEARRRQFFQIAVPVLGAIMRKYNAVAILDRRSVLIFDTNLDITQEAINRLDQEYADNPDILEPQQ